MREPGATKRWLLDEADLRRLAHAARRVFAPEPEVLAAYLYGSAARGEPAVDLDVAMLGEVAPVRIEALAAELQAAGAPAGPPIDLRLLSGAGPRFGIHVLREGRVLFERHRDRRIEHEAAIMSRWADFKPTWDVMRRRLLDRWARG